MAEETRPTRVDIAREFLTSIGKGDVGPSLPLLSPQAVYRVTGRHAMAGVFSGSGDIAHHLALLYQRTKGTYDTVKWEDWLVGQEHVAALSEVHIEADGRMYKARHLTLVRFDLDDLIREITVYFDDEPSLERFLGTAAP
jgi:ketosteroid isomerase-like protein